LKNALKDEKVKDAAFDALEKICMKNKMRIQLNSEQWAMGSEQ
jgi:DNA-binding Xre family transcriptional regulator